MNIKNITQTLINQLSHYEVSTICYFDRIKIYLDLHATNTNLNGLLASNPKNTLIMKEFTPNSHLDKMLDLFQPDARDIKRLKVVSGDCAINYIECAIDFMTDDTNILDSLCYFFNRHLIKATIKNYNRQFYFKEINHQTVYFTTATDDRRLVMYSDLLARKNTALQCLHLEYRIEGVEWVKNEGIITVNNLINFNHERLWDNLLDLRRYNLTKLGFQAGLLPLGNQNAPSRKTLHKWGAHESKTIESLQEYLQTNPEREPAFVDIKTTKALKELVDNVFW
ncbi:MAG: hypothetical protein PHY16_18725 [Methylobacter sp.]|nr:hypothetical protein [Methylobacter sp.]